MLELLLCAIGVFCVGLMVTLWCLCGHGLDD